jgi:hypothetical protein
MIVTTTVNTGQSPVMITNPLQHLSEQSFHSSRVASTQRAEVAGGHAHLRR